MNDNRQPSFIPVEMGSLPRILLIDFDNEVVQHLSDCGYSVFAGHSGLGELPYMLPKHQSEIELIFWDTSNLRNDQNILTNGGNYSINSPYNGRDIMESITNTLKDYFKRMREKGGFVGIFLGDIQSTTANGMLSEILDTDFTFFSRRTSTLKIEPVIEDDIWYDFFNRFVLQQNISYGINWNTNVIGLQQYFNDEDDNWHAVYFHHFALIPKIDNEKKKDALTFLLQDVLPTICDGEKVFPDKYYFRWANKEEYLPPIVRKLKEKNVSIAEEAQRQIDENNVTISSEMTENEYLSNILISDDSDLFSDDKKLSTNVHKVLENDLGFKVTDVDTMRLQVGESLKEDKWIEDTDDYFSLVEIKGTEKGAKANWIRVDLNAHIKEFEVVKDITGLNSMLIFNHERRVEPNERNKPFSGDNDLIEYCKKSKILLVPVYELFKMVRDIKDGVITKDDARKLLKESFGLFAYPTNLNHI